jgi:hypothetical protein
VINPWHPAEPLLRKTKMTKQDLINAIQFLERSWVGQGDQERLFKTIEALKLELAKRSKLK